MPFYSEGPDFWWWRWLVLVSYGIQTAFNSWTTLDYSTTPDVTYAVFGWRDNRAQSLDDNSTAQKDNMLYVTAFVASLPFAIIAAKTIQTHNYATVVTLGLSNCLSAWLRWVSVDQKSYGIAIVSSASLGIAIAVIVSACAAIPAVWFPKKQIPFAISVAVMSNYMGWAAGVLVIPSVMSYDAPDGGDVPPYGADEPTMHLVDSHITDMKNLLLVKALIASGAAAFTALVHREKPHPKHTDKDDGLHKEHVQQTNNPKASYFNGSWDDASCTADCKLSRPFVIQGFAHALLGGVSFIMTGVLAGVMSDLNFDDNHSKWMNFAFVISGVISGLIAGKIAEQWKGMQENLIIFLYIISGIGLSIASAVAYHNDSISGAFGIYIFSMGMAGAGSLGFIGIALSHACRHMPGIPHAYAAGAIEWWIQLFTFILGQVCVTGKSSLLILCLCTWAACIVAVGSLIYHRQDLADVEEYAETEEGRGLVEDA